MFRRLTAVLCVAGAAFVLWASSAAILPWFSRWLDVGERPVKADYVIVLLGDEQTRPFVAAALVKEGWAQTVLLTEIASGPHTIDGLMPPLHEIARDVLIGRGVPPDRIVVLPAYANSTFDEARALNKLLDSRPNARVLAVTSDYHSRRSRWIFRRVLGNRAEQVTFVAAPTDYYVPDRWWRSQWGARSVASEYLKLAFYLVRYGHLVHFAAACLLLVAVAAMVRRRQADRQGVLPIENALPNDRPTP